MQTLNVELIRKVIEKIRTEPKSFSMSYWWVPPTNYCGTIACFAGHCVIDSGYTFFSSSTALSPNGTEVSIATEATKLLGLPYGIADLLFFTRKWPLEYQNMLDINDNSLTEGEVLILILERVMEEGTQFLLDDALNH